MVSYPPVDGTQVFIDDKGEHTVPQSILEPWEPVPDEYLDSLTGLFIQLKEQLRTVYRMPKDQAEDLSKRLASLEKEVLHLLSEYARYKGYDDARAAESSKSYWGSRW